MLFFIEQLDREWGQQLLHLGTAVVVEIAVDRPGIAMTK